MQSVILEARKLKKSYKNIRAVQDLSLEVQEGEVFGFLGPNGAGKTTTINMLCGLLKPDSGEVLLEGRPLQSGQNQARAMVGVCPQDIVLWEKLTCLEQLVFIGQMYDLSELQARRNALGLLEELDLEGKRDQRAGKLSGGLQRRLNIAMALVHDPRIVVLDEPEAGLDPQSRVKVREYIQGLARKKTVILSTHNMDEAERVADRVAIIDQGQLLVLDTPAALKASVGEGDIIEINLTNGWKDGEAARLALGGMAALVTMEEDGRSLQVRALDGIAKLPAILECLHAAGYASGQVRIRQNTLEVSSSS